MKTRALRLYGASDLRLEEFELPEIKSDEILVEIVSDSICMSTYKCARLGQKHKRVPADIDVNPTIMGHEFAGNIVRVGDEYRRQFSPGMKFTLQPALNYKGSMWSPGYSYRYLGGDSTYGIVPHEVMDSGCLLEYTGEAYFQASLAEPMSCSIGAQRACFHTRMGVYSHEMGIKAGGKMAILAGAGPMGLGAVDYALHGDRRPALLVVSDIDETRLERARKLFPAEKAKADGIDLVFVNTKGMDAPWRALREMSGGGFDDVFVYAPVKEVAELGSSVLGRDGCLNFFAGPEDSGFTAGLNYYDVHYNSTHVIGTTGGNTDDMREALRLSAAGRVNPAVMVTHIGGLDAAGGAILNLPHIPGGKKLIYTHLDMPLTAISDFGAAAGKDPRFGELASLVEGNGGLWNAAAERYLLSRWSGMPKLSPLC